MVECSGVVALGAAPGNGTDISSSGSPLSIIDEAQSLQKRIEKLKFIAYGVTGSIIIALGILGNVINLVVLTRPNLKGVTFVYLTWLAISDLMSLVVSVSSILRLHGIQPRSYAAAVYYAHVELSLVNAFMASSVFLVVALTIDRYFSVCLPTRFKEVHNVQRARLFITIAYVAAFLLYIPVCFQKTPIRVLNGQNKTEFIPCENKDIVSNAAFKVYLLIKEILVRLGPVVLLAILNATIIVTFRKTMKKRRDLLNGLSLGGSSTSQREGNKKFREEKRLIILLAGIVVLFFFSMTPAAILTLLNSDKQESNFGFQLFRAIANVLELSNYALNFYVYCLCSSEIRRTFLNLISCNKISQESSYISSRPSFESSTRM